MHLVLRTKILINESLDISILQPEGYLLLDFTPVIIGEIITVAGMWPDVDEGVVPHLDEMVEILILYLVLGILPHRSDDRHVLIGYRPEEGASEYEVAR